MNRHHNFTQEELDQALKNIAGEYEDKPRISNMLASRKPQKKPDDLIYIHLENQLQQQQINRIYNTLLYRLKEELQNDAITLQTEIAREEPSGDQKLYTAEDKYLYMEKKNQYLKQLKQDFDLDFD